MAQLIGTVTGVGIAVTGGLIVYGIISNTLDFDCLKSKNSMVLISQSIELKQTLRSRLARALLSGAQLFLWERQCCH